MDFLLKEDILLEGDTLIENDETDWMLDISDSTDWIKDSKIKFNNPAFKNAKYAGPTHTSNYVTNYLYMGGYPNTPADINKLINAGINTFVCLNGSDKNEFYKYENYLPKNINYINEPIDDMNTISDKKILLLCETIVERIRVKREKVFIHCAGGHGRTGTVVAVILYLIYKLPIKQIFDYLQFIHDQRHGNFFGHSYYTIKLYTNNPMKKYYAIGQVPSPQTEEQIEQVKQIIFNFSYEVS